jgi:hypothetical protein
VFGRLGILLYLCAWAVIPGASIAESFVSERRC